MILDTDNSTVKHFVFFSNMYIEQVSNYKHFYNPIKSAYSYFEECIFKSMEKSCLYMSVNLLEAAYVSFFIHHFRKLYFHFL